MKLKNNLFRSTAAIIATLLALSFTGCGQNPIISESPSSTGVVSESTASSEQTAGGSVDGSFTIHFLDVGQADSALITCDGHSMLIDGGNVDDSNVLYSVMQRETDEHLDYVVGTHAHEDHIGGLSGAFEAVTADMTLCPVTEYDSKAFRDFASYAEQKGGGITIPDVGETYTLGEAEFTIVGVNSVPDDTNNTSIVLRIVYGDTSFLFTGDAEQEAENVILASGQDIQSTVLKVGHHGSSTSTSEAFLDAVNPTYAVISCGTGNSYGHPHQETLDKLQNKGVEVYRTDLLGDIYCTSDGKEVSFTSGEYHDENRIEAGSAVGSKDEQDKASLVIDETYVLNTSTMKFHKPDCSAVESMSQKNRIDYMGPRDELIQEGYSACGYCQKVFHLDGYEDYFIKTGTYSSKYEFRNAHIHNPKEINEMGEYFLFLNHLTCSMASPLNNRCFYGANTTNEWVVREYIKDKENNPTIYNGLPLHTEYRVFVDFDTKEILGASPYWRSDVMKNEFKKVSSPQERHDYVVYKMHEDILNQRYHESVQTVLAELKKVIPRIELTGQWSVDVMRNGNDYYIIDMALAEHSALNDCVPKNLLRAYPQQWLPGESNN